VNQTPSTSGRVLNPHPDALNKKVMKLELVLMLLINALRTAEGVPTSLLNRVERILSESDV